MKVRYRLLMYNVSSIEAQTSPSPFVSSTERTRSTEPPRSVYRRISSRVPGSRTNRAWSVPPIFEAMELPSSGAL